MAAKCDYLKRFRADLVDKTWPQEYWNDRFSVTGTGRSRKTNSSIFACLVSLLPGQPGQCIAGEKSRVLPGQPGQCIAGEKSRVLPEQHHTGEAKPDLGILTEISSISIKDLTLGCFNLKKRTRKRSCLQCHGIGLMRI